MNNNDDDGGRFWKVAFEIAFQLWLFHTCQTFLLNFMLLLNQDLASYLKCRKPEDRIEIVKRCNIIE